MAIVPSTASSHDAPKPTGHTTNPNQKEQQPGPSTICPAPADGAADGTRALATPTIQTPPTMTIAVQWNLRGLAVRTSELQQLLQQHCPVVVALQEIKTKKEKDRNKLDRRRYEWRFCFKPSDGFSSGVALGIDKNVPHQFLDVRGPLQVVAARVEWPVAATFASIYICREDGRAEIEDKLDQLIQQLPGPIVLLGDFNAHSPLWGGYHIDARGRAIEEQLGKFQLIVLNDQRHTRIDPRDGGTSAIDLSIVSETIAQEFVWLVDDDTRGSDHYPIILSSAEHSRASVTRRPRWRYEEANWEQFEEIMKSKNPQNAEEMERAILDAARLSIPRTNGKVGRKAVHWWCPEVEEAVKERRRKLRRLRKLQPDHPEKEKALEEFKKARNAAREVIKRAKAKSWENFVSGIAPSSGTSEIWRRVNTFRNGPKVTMQQLVVNGTMTDDPKVIAETLADHFAEVSAEREHKPARAIPEKGVPKFEGGEEEVYNRPFSMEELNWAIQKSKGLSAGVDEIGYPMIRHLPWQLKVNLLQIYNGIWEEGRIPERWKTGIVVPIPKAGKNQLEVGNQRPITLVSCLGKTLERMVNRRLMTTLEEIGAIGQDQHGFRRGKGVDTYLAELEEEIGGWIRGKEHGELALLDLAKAYDTAEREPILQNLHRWGIRGRMGHYIEDFLRDRTFRVSIGGTLSEIRFMERGVPQGTILAVALFLVRMTEAKNYVPRGVTIKLYADDILLMAHGRSEKVVRKRIQKAVTGIEAWTEHHGFELSTSKSCLIHICRRNRHIELSPVTTEAGPIQIVKHAKLLGVTLDGRFNFRQHISDTKAATDCRNRILQVIGGHRISGARGTLVRVQQAIVQSKMFYAWGLVSSATPAATQPLGPSHLAGIRSASGAFRTSPTKAVYAESGELPYRFKACLATLSKAVKLEACGAIGNTHPLSKRGRDGFEGLTGERIPKVAKKRRIGDRGWYADRPKVDWEMSAYVRAGDPATKVAAAFGVLREKYRNFIQIFTDGSKEKDFVGCAIVGDNGPTAYRLPKECSVFSAEAYAIWRALKGVPGDGSEAAVIFTDSASAVEAVECGQSHHPWIQEIEAELERTGATLCWIPGHSGIVGNERADQAAKGAKDLEATVVPIPADDAIRWAKERLRLEWEREWHNERELFLRKVKPNTLPGTDRENQEEQRAITRLRIGHTRLTHEGLFHSERARCEVCHVPLTVEHILCTCRKFEDERDGMANSVYGILHNSREAEERLLRYLRETGLIHQI